MNREQFLDFLEDTEAGERYGLATLIDTVGYTHRLPGQRILIDEQLRTFGNLVGGPLTEKLPGVAKEVLESDQPRRVEFDLDKDRCWELGLGRGGAVEVFVEPFSNDQLLRDWVGALKAGKNSVLATNVGRSDQAKDSQTGTRLLVSSEGIQQGSLGKENLNRAVADHVLELFDRVGVTSKLETFRVGDDEVDVFLDTALGRDRLILFGAGHDTIPLVSLANRLGYDVTVVDERAAFATEERFPNARTVVCPRDDLSAHVRLTPRTLVVIMSHRLEYDCAALGYVLDSPAQYIGLLAPTWRAGEIKERVDCSDEQWEQANLHTPVGLDLGARTPEEMAVSIAGELTAFKRDRLDRFQA